MEPNVADRARIATMERMLLATFPPLDTAYRDGVSVGSALGVTGRANSAVVTDEVSDVAATVSWASAWLAEQGRTPLFRLSPLAPAAIADLLGRENAYNTTSCMHRRLSSAVGPDDRSAVDAPIEISASRPSDWISERDQAGQVEVAALMDNVDGDLAWLVIRDDDGLPVAAGRGVLVDAWLSVQAMFTLPHARGKGFATSILGAMHDWAVDRGAADAFLNVLASNATATSVYQSHGYAHAYDYTYFRVPTAIAGC